MVASSLKSSPLGDMSSRVATVAEYAAGTLGLGECIAPVGLDDLPALIGTTDFSKQPLAPLVSLAAGVRSESAPWRDC